MVDVNIYGNETPLSISYSDGTWEDVSPNSQPVTGQYDFKNNKANLKISFPATRFNGNPPTFMCNIIYKVTGNETGKVYLSGQDSEKVLKINQELWKIQIEQWQKSDGYFFWSYKRNIDTLNDLSWYGWDSWSLDRSVNRNWAKIK